MATRAEILRELGLIPQWRLRARVGTAGSATPAAAGPAVLDAAAAPEAADARQARITALDRDALVAEIAGCTACALCRTRRNTVPGVGDPNARWLFVGEAPGADEDAQGEPFVGQAGRLLDNMLAALGLGRSSDVYIANVLKCRPPNNRTPEPTEVEACRPFLDRQIDLVGPKLIVALGKSAASTLLRSDASVANLRNRVHRYRGIPLIVTYHPAYLLRTPADKAKAWEDLLFARRTLRESLAAAGA
ncbi:MAG: uracil-DNA glycosylase [Betaproteobacteria bacterium]|nr:uracil-DNA glycosylase [Betaproteobacteria bacterium]